MNGMTLDEALDYIRCALSAGCTQVCNARYRGDCCPDEKIVEALKTISEALKELETYRELGEPEELEQALFDLYG